MCQWPSAWQLVFPACSYNLPFPFFSFFVLYFTLSTLARLFFCQVYHRLQYIAGTVTDTYRNLSDDWGDTNKNNTKPILATTCLYKCLISLSRSLPVPHCHLSMHYSTIFIAIFAAGTVSHVFASALPQTRPSQSQGPGCVPLLGCVPVFDPWPDQLEGPPLPDAQSQWRWYRVCFCFSGIHSYVVLSLSASCTFSAIGSSYHCSVCHCYNPVYKTFWRYLPVMVCNCKFNDFNLCPQWHKNNYLSLQQQLDGSER